jgi:hypothetical protein
VAKKSGARGEDLLWAIWDNAQTSDGAKLSTAWQEIALRGGNRGAAADRDLDAMMQLFQSAQRFSERFPLSGADAFIREVSAEIIAGDVITAQGVRPDCVEILTVHAAKGREWDLVAVGGLQEGLWPNLRQRSSLLGAERLVLSWKMSVAYYTLQQLELARLCLLPVCLMKMINHLNSSKKLQMQSLKLLVKHFRNTCCQDQ